MREVCLLCDINIPVYVVQMWLRVHEESVMHQQVYFLGVNHVTLVFSVIYFLELQQYMIKELISQLQLMSSHGFGPHHSYM